MSTCANLISACYVLNVRRHSWLFPLVDAVLHHGGAGTTGASLRGTPSYLLFTGTMMTHPDSWHSYFDPSVVRVSPSPFRVCSSRTVLTCSIMQRPVLLGIARPKARGESSFTSSCRGTRSDIYVSYRKGRLASEQSPFDRGRERVEKGNIESVSASRATVSSCQSSVTTAS